MLDRLRKDPIIIVCAASIGKAMLADELLSFLFDGQSHPLAAQVAAWLASSRRFTAFVNTYHTKVRKKIRTTQEPETLRDLQLELETACLLLREGSLSLAYEPHHPREGRSPDFVASFTTSFVFAVEVTRLRAAPPEAENALDGFLWGDRFADMLCSKLGQLLSQQANLLVVGMDAPQPAQSELQSAMLRIQQRADANDPALLERHGFRNRAAFFRRYQRLSALLLRGIPLQGAPAIWLNSQAKAPLPAKVLTALSRSHMP